MTEREKMLAGQLYDPGDPELEELRRTARRLAALAARWAEEETPEEERQSLLRQLLGGMGPRLKMIPPIRFDYGCNTYMGEGCYFNCNTTILDCARVEFGDNVFVGPNCSFLTPMHPLAPEERRSRRNQSGRWYCLEYARPIRVESDVWLAGGVTVNGGVVIGRGSVIGSGSVVTRDIPPGVLAAGVPCRPIRPITEADRILPPAGR